MEETFDIPVLYKGKELLFKSQLLVLGYTHKIQVDVNGVTVMFEPDEERNYRVYIDPLVDGGKKIERQLLQSIAEAIENIVK